MRRSVVGQNVPDPLRLTQAVSEFPSSALSTITMSSSSSLKRSNSISAADGSPAPVIDKEARRKDKKRRKLEEKQAVSLAFACLFGRDCEHC